MKIVNLTPHKIRIIKEEDCERLSVWEYDSLGSIRVREEIEEVGEIEGIRIIRKRFSDVSDKDIRKLKEILRDKNTIIIVSLLAGKYLKTDERLTEEEKRRIFIIGNTVRNDRGEIVGADALTNIMDLG